MKLVSFGCSFIYGNDLHDCNTNFAKNVFGSLDPGFYEGRSSNLTWPALVAKDLGLVYECRAEGGSGNLKILDQIIENAHTNPDSIYIINWTWIDRFSYVNSEGDTWHNILPSSSENNAKLYYRNFHSTYTDKLNTLLYIKSAIDLLTSKNILEKTMMLYGFNSPEEYDIYTYSELMNLLNFIDNGILFNNSVALLGLNF